MSSNSMTVSSPSRSVFTTYSCNLTSKSGFFSTNSTLSTNSTYSINADSSTVLGYSSQAQSPLSAPPQVSIPASSSSSASQQASSASSPPHQQKDLSHGWFFTNPPAAAGLAFLALALGVLFPHRTARA